MISYHEVTQDLTLVPDFIAQYEVELAAAKREVSIYGNIEKNIASLPGITEHRFAQLQTIEAVLNYLNIQLRKIRRKHYQKYLEGYARALSSRDAEKYCDGEQEVIDMDLIINEIALVRNAYLGIMKGLDQKSYMLGHVTKLRVVGMESASL